MTGKVDVEVKFEDLVAAVASPTLHQTQAGRLTVSKQPHPFVSPTLKVLSGDPDAPFKAEVIFIEASAAVGKSTMASYLSAVRGVPFLNLAKVPVSTGSLQALVSNVQGAPSPVLDFHCARLPIIVDALDEGRLLSGEAGFESFLETAVEFILQDRSTVAAPKLIVFGRRDSSEIAKFFVEEASGGGPTFTSLEVGFFDELAARELIDAYARAAAALDASYFSHPVPVRSLVDAYFTAIEAALDIPPGRLWLDERGRAFAGYAPVLAALGTMLAELDNFIEVTNRLSEAGAKEAWEVIETVLHAILERERGKLCDQVAQQAAAAIPAEAYDPIEQLTLLTRYVQGAPLVGTGRVRLAPPDQVLYNSMVERYIPEHPFVRQGELGNIVLASVVLAHAVVHDLLQDLGMKLLAEASRQPFLWRSVPRLLSADDLVDGKYLGALLSSLWNDPVGSRDAVVIRSAERGAVQVVLPKGYAERFSFSVTSPITLYGQVRSCDVDVEEVRLVGHTWSGAQRLLHIDGEVVIIAERLSVQADGVTLEGSLWLEADEMAADARLKLHAKVGSRLGWGGIVIDTYPWNQFASTLNPPYTDRPQDKVTRLLEECSWRFASGVTLTLQPNYLPAEDNRLRWIEREFAHEFPVLLRMLIAHGWATEERMEASGAAKIRVKFRCAWGDLLRGMDNPDAAPDEARFVAELRAALT